MSRCTVFLMFGLCSHSRRVRLKAALHSVVSVRHQSTARVIREQMKPMLSNGSRGTLMSYTDHSVPSKRICSSELVPRGSLNCDPSG